MEANRTSFDFPFPSVFDAVSMEADEAVLQQERAGRAQASAISEEKALSDSEIKVPCNLLLKEKSSHRLNVLFIPLCWWFTSAAFGLLQKQEVRMLFLKPLCIQATKCGNKHGRWHLGLFWAAS